MQFHRGTPSPGFSPGRLPHGQREGAPTIPRIGRFRPVRSNYTKKCWPCLEPGNPELFLYSRAARSRSAVAYRENEARMQESGYSSIPYWPSALFCRSHGMSVVLVRKSDKRPLAQVSYVNKAGQRKRWTAYAKTRKEADEKLTRAKAELQQGTFVEPSRLTVEQWLDAWLEEYKKPALRPLIYEGYKTIIKLHLKPDPRRQTPTTPATRNHPAALQPEGGGQSVTWDDTPDTRRAERSPKASGTGDDDRTGPPRAQRLQSHGGRVLSRPAGGGTPGGGRARPAAKRNFLPAKAERKQPLGTTIPPAGNVTFLRVFYSRSGPGTHTAKATAVLLQ